MSVAPASHPAPAALRWWLCALLVAAIAAAYAPVAGFAFIGFDDPDYIWQNPRVLSGINATSVTWAFTQFYDGNWHPLTWLSHLLDVQLFGLNAGAHHLVSVLFHAANSVLLFLWLRRLTGFLWRSAVVAALFALHPLHVESVAWVAERKDVLSTFFFLLTLLAYTRYAQTQRQKEECRMQKQVGSGPSSILHPPSSTPPSPLQSPSSISPAAVAAPQLAIGNRQSAMSPSSIFYWLALVAFALGLMSKPMLVTLPFVLLLLDFWPLNRFPVSNFSFQVSAFSFQLWKRLLLEKIPFFILAAASCVVTVLAQHSKSAVMPLQFLPVSARLQNVLVSYGHYLEKTLWPSGLAAFYPLAYPIPAEAVIVAVTGLALLTGLALFFWRSRPYLLVGWCWFLGMLVPVIGLVQVGSQSMADRYTYLPLIGLFLAGVWLVADLSARWPRRRLVLAALAALLLVGCWQRTAAQVRYWQNSETLARHALAVTVNNATMEGLLGSALFERGQVEAARAHFAEAARIWPDCVTAQCDLALALASQGRFADAIAACQTVLKYHPRDPQVHDLLGSLFTRAGRRAEAIAEYQGVLALQPEHLADLNNLAWLLATAPEAALRDAPEAVRLAEHACQLTGYQRPLFLGTLAAAYAEAGRFAEAVATAETAVALAAALPNPALAKKNRELLELYQQKTPYHEPAHP